MSNVSELPRSHERWARFRFSVIGPLLAAPPERGDLQEQLKSLAAKNWRHPITGQRVQFGLSTIERWFYTARNEKKDPVQALRRKIRSDHGQHPSLSLKFRELLVNQYRQHPNWSYQLHADNLAVLIEKEPALGATPSYASVVRFMKVQGLIKRPRRGPVHSPGAQAPSIASRLGRSAVMRVSMSMLCGIWIFITVRCASYWTKAVGFTHCCWASLMIIPACAAMPSGIWQKEPRSFVTVCVRPCKSEPYRGLS
jgi:putative transposase